LIFPSDMTILQLKNEILQRVAKKQSVDPATVSPAGSSRIRIMCPPSFQPMKEDTQVGTLVAPEGSTQPVTVLVVMPNKDYA
jgi:hypothetical protein